MDTNTVWKSILSDIQLHVSAGVYRTFLARSELVSLTDSQAIIGCQQPLHITYLEKKYVPLIQKSIQTVTSKQVSLLFTVVSQKTSVSIDGPLFSSSPDIPSATKKSAPAPISRHSSIKFNPEYTFENFAVSSSNQMAYAAATAVAKTPGTTYNPFLLYGGVGVGKTHLMQAIGSSVLLQNPKAKIIYCTSEEFTNDIIEAIQTKTATSFKKRYRQVDLLLIDDVQFIAGKNAAQEEFFHTFNAIHQANGQIIMTSDRPPDEMIRLEDRLRSRFEGGLIIDIGPPDFELRTAIILIKAKRRGIDLPIEAAKLLAQYVDNPRALEGALIRIQTQSQLKKESLTIEMVMDIMGKSIKDTGKPHASVNPDKVIHTLAEYYNVKISQLKGTKRDSFLSLPRQVLYYLLHVEYQVPLMSIGDLLGGRDHTTVLHGVRKITTLLSTDEKLRGDIMGIKHKIVG